MTRSSNIYYTWMETIIGPLTIARTKTGLCWLQFGTGESVLSSLERWSRKFFLTNQIAEDAHALSEEKKQLEEYFQQKRTSFDLELDIYGTSFQKLVWTALREIPYGEVRAYKEIAQVIGAPKAIRAVGGANNKNNLPIIIPCHRVIGSNGALVGYGSGLPIKQKLLELEGYIGDHPKRIVK